jgi:hypothetical protein
MGERERKGVGVGVGRRGLDDMRLGLFESYAGLFCSFVSSFLGTFIASSHGTFMVVPCTSHFGSKTRINV